jgi:AraC-like DNA-binding protein
MSRRGFNAAFEKQIGIYPGAVLRRIRLEYAKQLLTERDMTLREIARRCGYRSQNTFCVAFQRALGMAPKQFQRQAWLSAYHPSGSPEISNSNKSLTNRKPNCINSIP